MDLEEATTGAMLDMLKDAKDILEDSEKLALSHWHLCPSDALMAELNAAIEGLMACQEFVIRLHDIKEMERKGR